MELEVGSIVEGKVSGITKFGAFVALPGGKSGLVHISEIANSFVSDVREHVQMGQIVKVRVLNVGPDGKINLSIKRTLEPVSAPAPRFSAPRPQRETRPEPPRMVPVVNGPSADQTFEDRLKKFMQESDSRMADDRRYAEHKQRTRRR